MNGNFGITLDTANVIHKIDEEQAANSLDDLQLGDRIYSINGHTLQKDELASEFLKSCDEEAEIVVIPTAGGSLRYNGGRKGGNQKGFIDKKLEKELKDIVKDKRALFEKLTDC